MGGIADEHVEWAIVNRLKAMLDEPPQTPFNVTQTFALFSSVLLWTKNRAWVAGNLGQRGGWNNQADHLAHDVREAMRGKLITEDPWGLSLVAPRIDLDRQEEGPKGERATINSDFEATTAEDFFKWLRDALAHGDGRTIHPIHKPSVRTGNTLLAGFQVEFNAGRGAGRTLKLDLFHEDMRRIGIALADLFCSSLSDGDRYFEDEAGTARVLETLGAPH
tara:strand:+ start:31861 stop:32520 length:660 start_codon:yes stop_codon:yes gene_type:complete